MMQLALHVQDCFDAWFTREKRNWWKDSDEYLDHCVARGLYRKIRKAVASPGASTSGLTLAELVDFVRRVRMPPECALAGIESGAAFPFERFRQGSTVTVFVAKRLTQNLGGQASLAGWPRAGHGSRDVLAVADLINVLGRDLRLEYELDLVPVAPAALYESGQAHKEDSAEDLLEKHLRKKRTGAVVSIGSGPHNLVSNEVAKRIFNDCGDRLPVRFRWNNDERRRIDFLNETEWLSKQLQDQESGIWYLSGAVPHFLFRETDRLVRDHLKDAKAGKRKYFYDCGMLAIDFRGTVPIILAAGHGGNATRACVQALSQTDVLTALAEKSSMEGRLVGCLIVARSITAGSQLDSLCLPQRRGWYVFDQGNIPDQYGFPSAKPLVVEGQ